MTVKRVTIELVGNDANLKRMLDELERKIKEISGQSTVRVRADTRQASTDMDELKRKLEELNRTTIRTKVDDKAAKAQLDELKKSLHEINKDWTTRVGVRDYERTKLQLDEINRKLREIRRQDDMIRLGGGAGGGGVLGKLFGRGGSSSGGGAAGAASNGAGGATSGLGNLGILPLSNPYVAGGIGGLLALIGSLIPAAVGTVLGGGIGLGGAGLATALGTHGQTQINAEQLALTKALAAVGKNGPTASQKITITQDRRALAHDRSLYGGFIGGRQVSAGNAGGLPGHPTGGLSIPMPGISQAFKGLETAGLDTLLKSLAPLGKALVPIFQQLGGFIKSMGPQLTNMFRSSIPFIHMFVGLMERAGKVLIPAFTQTMKEMQPYLPEMSRALMQIVRGLGNFLKDLGPGMKDSSIIWLAAGKAINGFLIGLAAVLNFAAHAFRDFGRFVNQSIGIAVSSWHWLESTAKSAWHGIQDIIGIMGSTISSTFHHIASTVSGVWSGMWGGIETAAQNAYDFIKRIVGDIGSALSHIPGAGIAGSILHMVGLNNGGWVPGNGSPNVDSKFILAAPGERVLSHTEVSSAGGPRAVDAMFGQARKTGLGSFHTGGWVMRKFRDELMTPGGGGKHRIITDMPYGHAVHVHINFNGIVTDPNAVATKIQKMLLDLKRNRHTDLGLA